MGLHLIEVREPGKAPRRLSLAGPVEVGRECQGWVLSDSKLSRRHLRLEPTTDGLAVEDLGSTNGTTVNGVVLTRRTVAHAGDVVVAGDTELIIVSDDSVTPPLPPGAPRVTAAKLDHVTSAAPLALAAPRPALDELEARPVEGAVVRFRPGTAGARVAGTVAVNARRARKRLAGLGSEPWGVVPQICLVDPFPDPGAQTAGEMMTGGTVVDADRHEIWMVVTAESPPEALERPLALLFGTALPAADDLPLYLEGYGLAVAEQGDGDEALRGADLPSFDEADDELRPLMARSFVSYIIGKEGTAAFLQFLATASPGRLDSSAERTLGTSLTELEEAWRGSLAGIRSDVKPGQFLRLSLRYLRPHVRREVEIGVYMLLALGFTVIFPYALRYLLDSAIPSGHFSRVEDLLGFLSVALVVSLLASLRQAYVSAKVAEAVVREVRAEMFSKLHELSAEWHDRHPQGDVMTRLFSDVPNLQAGLSQTLQNGLYQMVSLVVSAGVALNLNWLLGVIVIASAPLVAFVYKAMGKGAMSRSRDVQEATAAVMSVAGESVSAEPTVKAFGLQSREKVRFARTQDRLYDKTLRLTLFGGIFEASVSGIVSALRVVVLGIGAWLILHHDLTIGGLVAFVGVMGQVISPATVLTGLGQQLQAAAGSLARVNEVLDEVPRIADCPDARVLAPLSGSVTLDDVSFSYRPERPTLQGVDCQIAAGSKAAFVGPTGAGKSSILQLLLRSYDPDAGAVRFDGVDLRDASVASLRSQLGIVFQDTFLFDTTVRENIALARPSASEAEVEEAARQAELHDFILTLPRGYDTRVGALGGRLSGGQKQRLALARALLRNPRILLLDEATSALDPRTERLVAATLDRVGKGRTTISVTHRLGSVVNYDKIFVVVDGRIAEQGTHAELLAANGTYAGLWAEQSGGSALVVETPFDVAASLAAVPFFAGLGPEEMATVGERLRSVDLAPGSSLAEGGGQLSIVRKGRPRVVAPGPLGAPVTTTQLAPGEAFGLAALLGQETGSQLVADEPCQLLVLADDAMRGLAASFPSVAEALTGAPASVAPAGGTRLARATMGPHIRPGSPGTPALPPDPRQTSSLVTSRV